MHTLKLEQEVWNVSIFHNRALVSSVITVLSQIISGKEYMRGSLSCFGIEEMGVPSLSRWREVVAVRTFLSLSACEVKAAQAQCSERLWTQLQCICSGHYIMERAAGEWNWCSDWECFQNNTKFFFPVLSVIPPVCLGKAKPVEQLQ